MMSKILLFFRPNRSFTWRKQTRNRTWIQTPNPMVTLHYAKTVPITCTWTQILIRISNCNHYCNHLKTSASESVSDNVNKPYTVTRGCFSSGSRGSLLGGRQLIELSVTVTSSHLPSPTVTLYRSGVNPSKKFSP